MTSRERRAMDLFERVDRLVVPIALVVIAAALVVFGIGGGQVLLAAFADALRPL